MILMRRYSYKTKDNENHIQPCGFTKCNLIILNDSENAQALHRP